MMKLAEKVAIVTGAARGIGKEIAKVFASEGGKVVIVDINYDGALALSKEIKSAGGSAIAVHADVSIKDDVIGMVKSAIDRYGRVDILVNNAGIQTVRNFLDLKEDEWKRVIDVNLTGAFLCSQVVAREMVARAIEGSIINISSIHGYIPRTMKIHYDASKSGLIMLTKETALELAPYHIRVNCIAPGIIDTPMNQEVLGEHEKRKTMTERVPLKRIGEPADVAKVALFLASDESSYITGAVVPVDGGLSLRP
ncbi:MAG: glucose 1-dehydrogenase [Thermoplasmatales archaeon]